MARTIRELFLFPVPLIQTTPFLLVGITAFLVAFSAPSAPAAGNDPSAGEGTDVETMVVYGRGEEQLGVATAASEGRVSGVDLELRPIGRVGELLEVVPGLIATQHSGAGKSNQLFLRGFNLDHGTDFSVHLDGVPLNF